jgi:hypothetical protein
VRASRFVAGDDDPTAAAAVLPVRVSFREHVVRWLAGGLACGAKSAHDLGRMPGPIVADRRVRVRVWLTTYTGPLPAKG